MSIPIAKSIGEETLVLHFRAYSVPFEREYEFHPNRKWRFDFYLKEHGIAVEVEGGIWQNGRHNRASNFEKELEKHNAAVLSGIKLLRYTTRQVTSGEAINQILAAIGSSQQ